MYLCMTSRRTLPADLSATCEADTAGTSKAVQSQPATPASADAAVAAVASSAPPPSLPIFPPRSRC